MFFRRMYITKAQWKTEIIKLGTINCEKYISNIYNDSLNLEHYYKLVIENYCIVQSFKSNIYEWFNDFWKIYILKKLAEKLKLLN